MKLGQIYVSLALLCGLTACEQELNQVDDSIEEAGNTRALSGSFERVAIRRASDVAGGPLDPSLDDLLVSDAHFGETLEWIDGTTCNNWSVEPLDDLPISIEDPNLSDTQVPPNDPPVTVGDKRLNIGYRLACEGESLGVLLKVDERVLITPSPSGLSNVILEHPLSDNEILAFQAKLKSMKFFEGEPSSTWTDESLGGVSSYAHYRGAAFTFNRAAITENLLDGLGVLDPVKEILSDTLEERFPDYQPKLSDDTVFDYRPALAMEMSPLPVVTTETFTEAVFDVRLRHQKALDNPGSWEDGNMPLGADEREYVPSDEELLAAELGERLSAFIGGLSREEVLSAWKGSHIRPPTVVYDRFTFRHVDVMGSGRFFYASPPDRIVIEFGDK